MIAEYGRTQLEIEKYHLAIISMKKMEIKAKNKAKEEKKKAKVKLNIEIMQKHKEILKQKKLVIENQIDDLCLLLNIQETDIQDKIH